MGLADHITVHSQTGDTVEHAAEAVGCSPAEIAKSLTFLVDGKPVMLVMAGDTRAVSYTHLDVYKRQAMKSSATESGVMKSSATESGVIETAARYS